MWPWPLAVETVVRAGLDEAEKRAREREPVSKPNHRPYPSARDNLGNPDFIAATCNKLVEQYGPRGVRHAVRFNLILAFCL